MGSSYPLSGITVVEIGHTFAAPYAGMVLAELGASVIKIEPAGGDYTRDMPPFQGERSSTFQALNRGKRGVVLDLRDPGHRDRLATLVTSEVDVLLHNLKFGALIELGLEPESLIAKRPGLVYCNIGAFGRTGPRKTNPGYDPLLQAYSGLMSIMGEDGRPPVRVGVSVVDMTTGLWAVLGILAALLERARTGNGGVVDTSLFETALCTLTVPLAAFITSGKAPKREGSGLAQMVPYQAFATADSYVMVAAGNDNLFRRLCIALDRPELRGDPRFARNKDRVVNRVELIAILEDVLSQFTSAELIDLLEAAQVPCSPINTIDTVAEDAQLSALGILQTSPDGAERALGLPLSFDGERPEFRRCAPGLGQHTEEVFPDLASAAWRSGKPATA